MKENINYWKLASIILAMILILTLGIKLYNNHEVEIAGVPITNGNLNAISNLIAESSVVRVCDFDSNECFMIAKTS